MVCSVCKHCDSVKHVKKVNAKVLLPEQRTEERALNNLLWSSCIAAPALPTEVLGGRQGALASEALRAQAKRGSKLVRVVLTELLPSMAGKRVSDTSLQGEKLHLWAAAEQGAEKSQFWHRLPEMAVKA